MSKLKLKAYKFLGVILGLVLLMVLSGMTGISPSYLSDSLTGNELPFPLLPLSPTSSSYCSALPAPSGSTVTVSSEAELRNQAYNASAGTTIVIQTGVYNMGSYIHIIKDGITLRSETGNRSDVILDFGGMISGYFGILVDADDVTIADLTIRNAHDHGVSIQGRDRPTLYNLHIQDTRDQLVKVNPAGDGSEDGVLACSRLEYTTSAPDSYTNGISAHNAHRWRVRDNEWYRIRTIDDTPAPTILFWSGSSDTIVERNLLVDCYQGIAFGNASHSGLDHIRGIVRNNFIYSSMSHDVVIEMVHAQDWLVAHNTALLLDPSPGLTWGMEARYSESQGTFAYNLTNMSIWPDRDGASASMIDNVTNAQSSWFVNPASYDLHLVAAATDAIDQAAVLASVSDDFDGDSRPIGTSSDIGADEYGVPPPPAVTSLRVTQGVTSTGVLTATLSWLAPTDGITYTMRYSNAFITEANWNSAINVTVPFTAATAGSTEWLTPTVSYLDGDTAYFALKSQNAGGDWANLSNNAFWPNVDIYLPLILH
jgi:hypothetical protein